LTKRSEIVTELDRVLSQIPNTTLIYWQDTPTQYDRNFLNYRDTTEEYKRQNQLHLARLNIEIVAVIIETNVSAAELGNLALVELIGAVNNFSLKAITVDLLRSHKFVETKGKTAAQIELEIAVNYKF
jgi:hypothetical protein